MNKKGFTLVELLSVIVILGVLVLLAIPSVTRQVESSRRKAMIEDAHTVLRAVRDNILASQPDFSKSKTIIYDLEKINPLLEKKLVDSPFGNKYTTVNVQVEISKTQSGASNVNYQISMFDCTHTGFDYTNSGELDTNKIIIGNLSCSADGSSQSTSYVVMANANGGIISTTAGWKLGGTPVSGGDVVESVSATTTGAYPPFNTYFWCCQNAKPSIVSNKYTVSGVYDNAINYANNADIKKYCIQTNNQYSTNSSLNGQSCSSNGTIVFYFEKALAHQLLPVRPYQYLRYSLSAAEGSSTGAGIATKSIEYNTQYGTLPNATKSGYTLKGWYNWVDNYTVKLTLSGNTLTLVLKDANNNPMAGVDVKDDEWDIYNGRTDSQGTMSQTFHEAAEWVDLASYLTFTINNKNITVRNITGDGIQAEVTTSFGVGTTEVTDATIMNKTSDHTIYALWEKK